MALHMVPFTVASCQHFTYTSFFCPHNNSEAELWSPSHFQMRKQRHSDAKWLSQAHTAREQQTQEPVLEAGVESLCSTATPGLHWGRLLSGHTPREGSEPPTLFL